MLCSCFSGHLPLQLLNNTTPSPLWKAAGLCPPAVLSEVPGVVVCCIAGMDTGGTHLDDRNCILQCGLLGDGCYWIASCLLSFAFMLRLYASQYVIPLDVPGQQ
jgi:hypothetical protein